MATGSDGYGVHPAALDQVAGQLGKVATDLATANTDYTASVCYAATAFGEFGMDTAWSGFDLNWSEEIEVTVNALNELSQKVSTSSGNYQSAEAAASGGLQSARRSE